MTEEGALSAKIRLTHCPTAITLSKNPKLEARNPKQIEKSEIQMFKKLTVVGSRFGF
jgi:hypothetical protein